MEKVLLVGFNMVKVKGSTDLAIERGAAMKSKCGSSGDGRYILNGEAREGGGSFEKVIGSGPKARGGSFRIEIERRSRKMKPGLLVR